MIEYRITYLDTQRTGGDEANQTRGVSIFDKESTDTLVVDLVGAGQPDTMRIIDNNEDKFTTIRAKQLTIQFLSTAQIDAEYFSKGADSRWYVESWLNTTTNIDFKGYLVTDDLQDPFLPVPQVVSLIASDRLGTLKDIALVDDSGITPQGKWKISKFLYWILRKTGLDLDIYVINNIRPGGKQLTAGASFIASTKTIATTRTQFFYPGQVIAISGTASNNGTFTVVGVGFFLVQLVVVAETLTDETVASGVVFADQLDGHIYDKVYLDSKMFEGSEIGICQNCYDSLDWILRDSCFITQAKGSWWIVRVNELEGTTQEVAHFENDGTFVDIQTKTYTKNIGRLDTIKWANASQLRRFRRPFSFIKEIFRYQQALEVICNIDFSRGDFIANLPDVVEPNQPLKTAKSYQVADWTLLRDWPTPSGAPTNDSTAYIERQFNVVDYEVARFVVLTPPSVADTRAPYIQACPLDVTEKDRFSATVDYRMSTNPTTGGGFYNVMKFVVHGIDGSWWVLGRNPDVDGESTDLVKWWDTANWSTFTGKGQIALNFSVGTDYAQWQTLGYDIEDVPPIPIDGKLYVWLFALNTSASSYDNVDMYYQNLSFTFYPFINGSYQKYTGQYHLDSQTGEYKASRENEVKMSDSPRSFYKGAMFFFNGTDYFLTRIFYDSIKTPNPLVTDLYPYGEIQARDVWQQVSREMRLFSGQVRGLDSDVQDADDLPDNPDAIHNYLLTDSSVSTNNKVFLLTSLDQDRKSQLWQTNVIELFDSVLGKAIPDHIFKYLSQ